MPHSIYILKKIVYLFDMLISRPRPPSSLYIGKLSMLKVAPR